MRLQFCPWEISSVTKQGHRLSVPTYIPAGLTDKAYLGMGVSARVIVIIGRQTL